MLNVEFVMDGVPWEYPMSAVPREGDTVRLGGEERKVVRVLWDPHGEIDSTIPLATVYLGEKR